MAEDKPDSAAAAVETAAAETPKTTTDESSSVEETAASTKDDRKKEPRTIQDVKKAFQNLGTSSSQVIKTSVETFRHAEGKTRKSDEYADTLEDGLKQLKFMVDLAKQANTKGVEKWQFATVPCALFEKSLDDVFVAFLKWAIVEEDDKKKSEETLVGKINVSKSFRRLESYASWMHANAPNLENLTTDSVQDAWGAWKLKISYDKMDRLVWWVDVAAMDVAAVKARDPVDSLRLFCWFAHFVMFDERAQDKGMVFGENLGHIKFWSGMTILPPKLSLKLDRLTIGVLPIKMKQLYILESPAWCDVLVKMMKPFVSKKIKSRIVVLKDSAILEEELGKDCIPEGFASCDGKLTADFVAEKYFPNEVPKEKEDPETAQL